MHSSPMRSTIRRPTESIARCLALLAFCSASAAAQDEPLKDPLCQASAEGDRAQVQVLLRNGADPNVRDEKSHTPLMYAASLRGRSERRTPKQIQPDYLGVATLLLARHADPNARDESGRTPLLLAMEGSASEYRVIGADEEMVRLLIARGANVNAQDHDGWSALLMAAKLWADQPKLIPLLLASRADVNARLKDGRTALMLAVRLGKTDRLAILLANRAEVNAADGEGATALMNAAVVTWEDAALELMKLLLAKGADPNVADKKGKTAADRAADAGYLDRATYLLAHEARTLDQVAFLKNARNRALVRAILSGSIEAARGLLEQGADPDSRDDVGRTVLMIACDNEYSADKAILLLDRRASVDSVGANGDTA